ncbi:MAG: SAM-dependent methyltransferase, partial [Halofilum sp. (in: g-proteobacteria)]|nr:SAM-dependent methyltransferase [Halofilum sp. (in: g-proteobacteria)]
MPRNTAQAADTRGTIEVDPACAAGLRDLEGFSHVILLFHFHRSEGCELEVVPPGESRAHGVFATRSPRRPNGIGLSVVRLDRVERIV